MNTNTRKTNIFVTIGAIALLAHAVGFLLPWCNMNGVKVQEGLAFIAGEAGSQLLFVWVSSCILHLSDGRAENS